MNKHKILYVPTNDHTQRVFKSEVFQRMLKRFEVSANETGKNYTPGEIAALIAGFDGLITGWGTPALTGEVFEKADILGIIAHSAGSVKYMLSEKVVERYIIPRNICVFSANHAIAYNVAESTVGLLIMASHRFIDHALAFRERGLWRDPEIPSNGQYLQGSTVGLVSASKVGKEVIRMLKPFDLTLLVYDPFLDEQEADELGVVKTDLDSLFSRSNFVSIHAPNIPETWGMIGSKQLRLMKEGAILINTARGKILDHSVLLEELQEGRIMAVLDVTEPEPLPPDSPFRKLSNCIILPHISGAGYYGYFRIGSMTLQALEDFFAGKMVRGAIRFEDYSKLA